MRAAQATSGFSAKIAPRVPKLPPTSRITSRRSSSGTSSDRSPGRLCRRRADRCRCRSCSCRSPASYSPTAARGSIGDAGDARHPGLELGDVRWRARTLPRWPRASPTSASMQTFEPCCSCSSGASGRGRVGREGHAGQRLVVDDDLLGAVLRGGDASPPPPWRRLRRRSAPCRAAAGKSGAVKVGEPSVLASGISAGCHENVLLGIGFRPSASQSVPVSTASTPGTASAAAVSIERMSACACGERTIAA